MGWELAILTELADLGQRWWFSAIDARSIHSAYRR
jgi:hypothetical protein